MKKYFLFFLLITFSKHSFAQNNNYVEVTAVPSLSLQQSPLLIGAGNIGTAIPMQEAMGFYYNPAQLGYFSRRSSLSGFVMPNKTKWLGGNLIPDLTFQTSGFTLGNNSGFLFFPVSFGFGYIRNKFDMGNFRNTGGNNSVLQEKNNDYVLFDCYSLGFGYNYYLSFNLGFAVKAYRSVLTDIINDRIVTQKDRGTAFDFGAMLITPVSQILLKNTRYNFSEDITVKPDANFTLGYSISNIGKKVYYFDPEQGDPLPRTARLGYSFNLGMDLFIYDIKLKAFDYSFTAEAEDLLIKRDTSSTRYQNLLGDIKLGDNLIELKGNNMVVVHRGHIFKLFETLFITTGRFHGRGNYHRKSDGFGISSEGAFKLLSILFDNSTINYIADHLVLEYYNTNTFADSFDETNFKGIAIYFRAGRF